MNPEQQAKEYAMPQNPGCPDFEAMLILRYAKINPGVLKTRLVWDLMEALERQGQERILLRHMDALEFIHNIERFDQKIYLTPLGETRLKELLRKNGPGLRALAFETQVR